MWVKRSQQTTLQEAFDEAMVVEKYILILKTTLSNPPTKKKDQLTYDHESIQKFLKMLANDVINLKKISVEGPSNMTNF